jgi:hypothetical protein
LSPALLIVFTCLIFPTIMVAQTVQNGNSRFPSQDCTIPVGSLPQGASRVYIALRNGVDGPGRSMADARDGSRVTAFDAILRCFSEGCSDSKNPQKSVAKTENLIVCLGPGIFSTLGNYDYLIDIQHTNPAGFTIGKGWRIHGSGKDKTVLKLSDYLRITTPGNLQNMPENVGTNVVLSTNSDQASGVEISDLTIDGNYPDLKSRSRAQGLRAVGLEAIHLRSDGGGNWLHDVNVIRLGLEIGQIGNRWEAFPVWIASVNATSPNQNRGNVIENVSVTQSYGAGVCTTISVANATAEVRNNVVEGYQIGYGGWKLGETIFHDNTAINTDYGFNIDSLVNRGMRIENNRIIHPRLYGFVVGGGGTYADFRFLNNTVQIANTGAVGFIFQGNVTGAVVSGNKILVDRPNIHAIAIKSYPGVTKSNPNSNNIFQDNQIASGLSVDFTTPALKSQNCFFGDRDEHGNPRKDLPDNPSGPCISNMAR